jgi:hypothetical protein
VRKLYWAYGSNLCVGAMLRRCPAAVRVGPLTLKNAALVFRSCADVVGRRGSHVAGGLWLITDRCEESLDRYEGVASGLYDKRHIDVDWPGSPELPAGRYPVLFYKMMERGIMPPHEGYLQVIAQGYRDFGLDLALLDRAVEHSWNRKEKTPYLRGRHRRKGAPPLAVTRGLSTGDLVCDRADPRHQGRVRRFTRRGRAEVEWLETGYRSRLLPDKLVRVIQLARMP